VNVDDDDGVDGHVDGDYADDAHDYGKDGGAGDGYDYDYGDADGGSDGDGDGYCCDAVMMAMT